VAIRSGLSGSTIMKHIPMPMKMSIIHTTLAMNNQIHAPHLAGVGHILVVLYQSKSIMSIYKKRH
jgi:hypothetical protein